VSSPILSATVEKKVLNFSETSHVSFIILLKNSMKTYFLECCMGGAKNVNFWKTVKPFFSNGNTPVSIDKFINDVNWLDIIGLHCLITLAGMLSNPEANNK
jgi:hypothetical protein